MFSIPRFYIPPYTSRALSPNITLFGLVWGYILRYKYRFLIIAGAVIAGESLMSSGAYIVKLIIDSVSEPGASFDSLLGYVAIYGAIMIFGPLLYRLSGIT